MSKKLPPLLFDAHKAGYNIIAMQQIERLNSLAASASYNSNPNITDATREKYQNDESSRLEKIIRSHAVRVVRVRQYNNGLTEYAYLDRDGRVVTESIGTSPAYGFADV